MKLNAVLVGALCATSLSACTAIKSKPVEVSNSLGNLGLQYSLPKALLETKLVYQNNVLVLTVQEPIYIGDLDASYVISGSSGLFSSQDYFLKVDPQSRLLSYVNSKSTGQLDDILVNLAASAGQVVGATQAPIEENSRDAATPFIVSSQIFDPMSLAECGYGKTCDFSDFERKLNADAQRFLTSLATEGATPVAYNFDLQLIPLFEHDPNLSVSGPEACRASLCYRVPAPYILRLSVGNNTVMDAIVALPNEAPLMALQIPSGVFADAEARIALLDGMPAQVGINKGNELVEMLTVPAKALKGFFGAVGEVFQLRIQYYKDEKTFLDSRDAHEDYLEDRRTSRQAEAQADVQDQGTSLDGLTVTGNPNTARAEESTRPSDNVATEITASKPAEVRKVLLSAAISRAAPPPANASNGTQNDSDAPPTLTAVEE